MNREIYRKIAKKNKISVWELKQEMQSAINSAYINPIPLAQKVLRKDTVPTVDEFIVYSSKLITQAE